MPLPKNWGSWESTKKVIRIVHNREVKKHFRDVIGDDLRATGRQNLKTVLLIREKDSAVEILNKQFFFQRLVSNKDIPLATMPEWWPGRVGSDIPQLVIVFRPPTKKTSYQISIPHYNGSRNPEFPAYKKGSWRGELILSDGSQLALHAYSESEAERVMRSLRRYISLKWNANRTPTFRPIRGSKFKEVEVKPIYADYYPHGQQEGIPALWRKYF